MFELLVLSLDDDDCDCDVVPVAVDSDDVVAAPVAALVFETFIEIGFGLDPTTRTLGCEPFPLGFATNSIVGADVELKTSGMVACVVPVSASTAMFDNPF